jgi:osmotically inducible lipoprotein OsmB
MRFAMALCVAAPLALAACSDLNSTEQRTLTGGAGGAAAGAILGAIGGNAGLGAIAGAGAGLIGGYLYDQYKKSQDSAYQQGYSAGQHSAAH